MQPHLKYLFQGYDVTLFAYGVTGTGKTHTMRGGLKLADRGVIPRLLSGIFRRGRKIAKDAAGRTTVGVSLSYYEIYNDKVFNLLEPPEKRTPAGLPLRAEASGRTVVADLSERACDDLRDFEKLYIEANANRVTAATKLNAHSSRSHAILRVKLTQTTGDAVVESTASAIDLAGSEDNRRTDNARERLVESAAINKSLFVLSQCIDAISRGDKRVPYRESKMTRILSLGQNKGIPVMILNLAPLRSYHLDTLSSLNVSSRAKRIEVREIENEVVFKQVPRPSPAAVARQPLRPLANAHNVHGGNMAAAKAAEPNRPVKAFSVYTDKAQSTASRPSAAASLMPRPGAPKRPLEADPAPRRAKAARPAGEEPVTMSAAEIEAMVEKVGELLTARTAAAARASPSRGGLAQGDASEAVQKRLEALERRVGAGAWRGDARSEGLRHLLEARQHKQRGDGAAALSAYEMALPYFPGQAKLLSNIDKLRSALGAPANQAAPAAKGKPRGDGAPGAGAGEREAEAETASDDDGDDGRTRLLLDVVNSRDAARIRGLAGFGAKRAQDLADRLERAALDGRVALESPDQLRALPGIGGRTVERAYAGLAEPA